MRESALAARRRALVEKLMAAVEEAIESIGIGKHFLCQAEEDALRAKFTALLASRWQT